MRSPFFWLRVRILDMHLRRHSCSRCTPAPTPGGTQFRRWRDTDHPRKAGIVGQ